MYMWNTRQRGLLSEKLADLGNIAIGSLVFGYVLHSESLNEWSLFFGFSFVVLVYWWAMVLEK